jgi:hypothetical protein
MTTYQKVVSLLGKDFAAILQLTKKLFITWGIDSKKFFHTINHLKKEEIIGLMDGSYEIVRKKVVGKLFVFSEFFFIRDGLHVWGSLEERFGSIYKESREYKSINNLKPAFDLNRNMYDSEIIKEMGGEEKVRENAVTMDQIEQLIKNQWGGKAGIMLNNGFANIFYVIGKNNQLFAVRVDWCSDGQEWNVLDYRLGERGRWSQGDRVFSKSCL